MARDRNTRHTPMPPPPGLRDLGPAAAYPIYAVQIRLMRIMERHGYERVMTPSFDDVMALAPTDEPAQGLFRFADPATGRIVALRNDITPQVARLVATRLPPEDAPFRLCYSARVYRQRSRFGIAPRELIQAGAELIGASGLEADLEILELAARCAESLELGGRITFSLGHSMVLTELLSVVADHCGAATAIEVAHACQRRAVPRVQNLLVGHADLSRAFVTVLLGHTEEASSAVGVVSETAALALAELEALGRAATRRMPDVKWTLDMAADRGFAYYTGFSFMGLIDGPGRPLVSGGRYDDLVGRFGGEMDAAGFMFDEQAVLDALSRDGWSEKPPERDLLIVDRHGQDDRTCSLVNRLREGDNRPRIVVRSLASYRWLELEPDELVTRMRQRRFRRLVFVDRDGYELIDASSTRWLFQDADALIEHFQREP